MQTVMRKPFFSILVLALVIGFAGLVAGGVAEGKGHKGGDGNDGGGGGGGADKFVAGGSILQVMACTNTNEQATDTGRKVADKHAAGAFGTVPWAEDFTEPFTVGDLYLGVDGAELFAIGDVLRFANSDEWVKVEAVDYDLKVLKVERAYQGADGKHLVGEYQHPKDAMIYIVPESIEGGSYIGECPDETNVVGAKPIEMPLLYGKIKTSTPTDLLILSTMECALWTNVQTTQDTYGEAFAQVNVWVTVNGIAVPVDPRVGDDGKVTMCSRAVKIQSGFNIMTALEGLTTFDTSGTTEISLEHKHQIEYFIRTMMRTRNSNAFNWYALDIDTAYGSPDANGYHHVVLWGELDAKKHNLTGFGADYAAAAVGKRTLIIEPVKFPTGSY